MTGVAVSTESDTAEGWIEHPSRVNRATVKAWLAEHSASMEEFLEDNGDHDTYQSNKVFEWLGY